MTTSIILAILAVIAIYVIYTYNKLVTNKNLVEEGFSGIEVQLKQRANLIPNLIETVRGYVGHESSVLEKVTQLRTKCLQSDGVKERAKNENMLTGALKNLFAVSENYPDLKASENFIQLQESLKKLEDDIQLARRYYNGTVRDNNILVQSFPSNIIAKSFQFKKAEFFELDNDADRAVPSVNF